MDQWQAAVGTQKNHPMRWFFRVPKTYVENNVLRKYLQFYAEIFCLPVDQWQALDSQLFVAAGLRLTDVTALCPSARTLILA